MAGDPAGAEAAYRIAIDSGHTDQAPVAAVALGELLARQGDVAGARAAIQKAIGSGHGDAASRALVDLDRLPAGQQRAARERHDSLTRLVYAFGDLGERG